MNADFKEQIVRTFEKLKKDKKAILIILLGVTGMLLIMLSGTTDNNEKQTSENYDSGINYENELLNKVTDLVESINGAGEAKIMITFECGEETLYAADTDISCDKDDTSTRSEYIIIEDENNETGLVIKKYFPKVMGVAIVCQGGDNPIVKEKIYSAISALFNLSTNKISIAKMA